MKVVILAGGFGTRLSEETSLKPKPMVEIGNRPILWHILKIYSYFGFNDFLICLGYKGYVIKEYFANYFLHMADVTFDMSTNEMEVHQKFAEPWKITLVDTGLNTMTGGRIKRVQSFIGKESFMVTYGDGVADIDINELLSFHNSHNAIGTVTAVQASARFGALESDVNGKVIRFKEKPITHEPWINGGFFVFRPEIFDYIDGDNSILEKEPLEKLVQNEALFSYSHNGFWKPMDTLREKNELENLWSSGRAPWRFWT